MANFLEDIIEIADDEPIEAIIIGPKGIYYKNTPDLNEIEGKLLTFEEAKPFLDYEYDDGLGCADCHAIYAWTPSRVLFIHEYDGATSVASVPRNPTAEYSVGMI
jgi:hypothetical protein